MQNISYFIWVVSLNLSRDVNLIEYIHSCCCVDLPRNMHYLKVFVHVFYICQYVENMGEINHLV